MNADARISETLTDKQAYLRNYYADHQEEIRAKQRVTYEAKHTCVSSELLEHLRTNPRHALRQVSCAECERLGPVATVVCLECGRFPLKQVAFHTLKQHELPIAAYRRRYGYDAGESLTDLGFHAVRSRLSKSAENLARITGGRRKLRHPRGLRPPPETALSRRLKKLSIPDWEIAERRLAGKENKRIAADLHVSPAFVNERCRRMGLGSKPVLFWRGEPVSDRHLDSLLRESEMSTKTLALTLAIPVHRLARALRRRGKPLSLDVADMVRKKLQQIKPSGPRTLRAAERQEIKWKSRALRSDLAVLRNALTEKPSADLAATICDLHRHGQVTILFRWAREFVTWVADQYGSELELSRIADVANEFLASEYPVSADTLPHLVRPAVQQRGTEDTRHRCAIADVLTVLGGEPWIASADLLRGLRELALAPWTGMRSEKRLAKLLRPLGLEPHNRREGARVLKGYRRADLRAWGFREAAQRLAISVGTLKAYIRDAIVPAPPLVRRRGLRGSGRFRVWMESDIVAAQTALDNRPPKTLARSRNPFPPRREPLSSDPLHN